MYILSSHHEAISYNKLEKKTKPNKPNPIPVVSNQVSTHFSKTLLSSAVGNQLELKILFKGSQSPGLVEAAGTPGSLQPPCPSRDPPSRAQPQPQATPELPPNPPAPPGPCAGLSTRPAQRCCLGLGAASGPWADVAHLVIDWNSCIS